MKAPIAFPQTRRGALAWAALACLPALAAPGSNLAIVYPDIGEPYRGVFVQIIEGIEAQAQRHVASFAVGRDSNPQDLSTELRRLEVRTVIALGRDGLRTAEGLDRGFAVVAGGVLSVPETDARNFVVHSLSPDPGLLFARLKTFVAAARRVHVVYDPLQNEWLLRLARDAAKAAGLELEAHEASDLPAAVRLYQQIATTIDVRRDVLWLPQDTTTVEDSTVLPLVLQESWNRGFAVISSSVAQVRRGALFCLYPDNLGLGRSLASSALAQGAPAHGVIPLKDVLVAVNVRTASHLGIALDRRHVSIDRVFPEQ